VQSDTRVAALQRAWDYHELMGHLRRGGIASLIWGVISLGVGGLGMLVDPFMAFLALLGLMLVAEGIWLLAAPSPAGLIGEGVIFTLLGVTNVVFGIIDSLAGEGGAIWIGIGAFQFYFGVQAFRRYARDKDRLDNPPAQNLRDAVAEIGKDIRGSKATQREDIVEFLTAPPFKMRLDDEMAVVFMSLKVSFLSREDVKVQFTDDRASKNHTAVVVELPDRKPMKGRIRDEYAEQYRVWAAGARLGDSTQKPGAGEASTEEWVKQARAAGQTDEQIIATLVGSGWAAGDARSLIEATDGMDALRGKNA